MLACSSSPYLDFACMRFALRKFRPLISNPNVGGRKGERTKEEEDRLQPLFTEWFNRIWTIDAADSYPLMSLSVQVRVHNPVGPPCRAICCKCLMPTPSLARPCQPPCHVVAHSFCSSPAAVPFFSVLQMSKRQLHRGAYSDFLTQPPICLVVSFQKVMKIRAFLSICRFCSVKPQVLIF